MNKYKKLFSILALLVIAVLSWGSLAACEKEKTLESIAISKQPDKISYVEGDKFAKDGMEITASYSDGTTEIISAYTLNSDGALKVGDKSITVTYNDKTANVSITVEAKTLTEIKVTTMPKKIVYYPDELFSKEGMVITASYNNGTSSVVTDYTYDKTEPLIYTNDKVTVSYGGKTAIVDITVHNAITFEAENLRSFSSTIKKGVDSDTATGNAYIGELRPGDSVCIDFTSTGKGEVNLKVRAATAYLSEVVNGWIPIVMKDTQFNLIAEILVNGVAVEIPDSILLEGGQAADLTAGDNNLWFLWTNITIENLSVIEGKNSIVMKFKSSGIKNYWNNEITANVDSFEVAFKGDITGKVIPLPEYTGSIVTDYSSEYENSLKMEAENSSYTKGTIENQETASGGKALGSTAGSGNSVSFVFNMDESGTAAIELVAACAKWSNDAGGNTEMKNLGSYINLKINGIIIDLSGVDLVCRNLNDWINWQSIVIDGVELLGGENIIIITMNDNGGYYCPNLDVLTVYSDTTFSVEE